MTDTLLAAVPEYPRRLVYFGSPEMAVAPLEALVRNGFDVALVVTGADKRRGRGGELTPSPVKAAALGLSLDVSDRVEDCLEVGADLGVVVAFGRLIRQPILEQLPMINIHFSLLPRWRGAAPVERALLAGDRVTGTSLMQLEVGLDTGPVYDVRTVPLRERVTAAELRAELVEAGVQQLLECLQRGLRDPQPQKGEAVYAPKFAASEFAVDWNSAAVQVDRVVRLGSAWTTFRGKRLRIHAAAPLEGESNARPATISGVEVTCGDGRILRLDMVQPEGKGPMEATSWIRGARPEVGETLGS